jgi:hypothetical protein
VDLRGRTWTPNCHVAVGIEAERFLEFLVGRLISLG